MSKEKDNPVVQQSLTTESMKCYICKKAIWYTERQIKNLEK